VFLSYVQYQLDVKRRAQIPGKPLLSASERWARCMQANTDGPAGNTNPGACHASGAQADRPIEPQASGVVGTGLLLPSVGPLTRLDPARIDQAQCWKQLLVESSIPRKQGSGLRLGVSAN